MKRSNISNSFRFVKATRKFTGLITLITIAIGSLQFVQQPISIKERTEKYFKEHLQILKQSLQGFQYTVAHKEPIKELCLQFQSSRKAYKGLSLLSEYFNPYETKGLNGPAIDRVEEDHPDDIIPASGFQAIEQLLYSKPGADFYSKLHDLLQQMFGMITRLENETDRSNKFKAELVWDAIRSGMVRLIAIGVTGNDSPAAQYSLTEARTTIQAIKEILGFFEIDKTTQVELRTLLEKADQYLSAHENFSNFNRLDFITDQVNPIFRKLLATRKKIGVGVPDGSSPVNYDIATPFETGFFNVDFFSPGGDYAVTPERIALGKKLFADPILSASQKRSCASCHIPSKAFADGMKTPFALDEKTLLPRNTPTMLNSAFQTRLFWDSRTDILENQLDEVVHNEKEMKGSLKDAVKLLDKDQNYRISFQKAYNNEKEPITAFNIANAIASYIRSLNAMNSRFDQYMRGDKTKLTTLEKTGFNLFAGKAKCATCHFIPLFNGLVPPVFTETESEVLGVPKTKARNPATLDDDLGKYLFTKSTIHKYSFKTPTLRNIELTAPYMHNGVFRTLEEVVEFYNTGGGKGLQIAPANETLPFDKLSLTLNEVKALVAFMKSLTDTTHRQWN